jgi:hypothetical protein
MHGKYNSGNATKDKVIAKVSDSALWKALVKLWTCGQNLQDINIGLLVMDYLYMHGIVVGLEKICAYQ